MTVGITEHFYEQIDLISLERKDVLQGIARQVIGYLADGEVTLAFICTHNSRRSQAAQVLCELATRHYGLDKISLASAGTEVTAFNHRMVSALQRKGVEVTKLKGSSPNNPHYLLNVGSTQRRLYSKHCDDLSSSKRCMAIMVCDRAAETCPIIHGTTDRILLTYRDPKWADSTGAETRAYDDCVEEIGREMTFLFRTIRSLLSA
jgi:arsenate reductase